MALKRDNNGNVYHDDADVPADFAGSWHIGNDVWHSRCRECGLIEETTGPRPKPRWDGIGRHEYAAHGLDVPGINVGILG